MGQECEWWLSKLNDDDQKILLNIDVYGVGWFTLEEMKTIAVWPATKAVFNEFFDAGLN